MRARLDGHLAAEEEHALPIWLAAFSPAEHERFAATLRRSTPLRDAGLMISWLLDHAPAGMAELATGHLPAPLRLAHQLWWRRTYQWRWGSPGPRRRHGRGLRLTRPRVPAAKAGDQGISRTRPKA